MGMEQSPCQVHGRGLAPDPARGVLGATCHAMNKYKHWISEWARDLMRQADLADYGYSDVNVVERLLRDPGRAPRAESKVLWWPRNRRIAAVSRAAHCLTNLEQTVILVHYKAIMDDDGKILTKQRLADITGVGLRKIDNIRRKAEKILLEKLRS